MIGVATTTYVLNYVFTRMTFKSTSSGNAVTETTNLNYDYTHNLYNVKGVFAKNADIIIVSFNEKLQYRYLIGVVNFENKTI